ncbi:MAG: hypothetical protein ACRDRH_28880 [Pseudonocardia sp.]
MNSYYVELRYLVPGADRDALDRHTDAMMDALLVEPHLTDPDVGVNLGTGAVDVCASVQAEDEPAALRLALVAIRSASRHVGQATIGWDDALEQVHSSVRPAAMADL